MTKPAYYSFAFAAALLAGSLLSTSASAQQSSGESEMAVWSCTGGFCPWGESSSNPALVWPQSAGALNARYGYTVSAGIYLPASIAIGTTVRIDSGTATLYAGQPDASHGALTTLGAGASYTVPNLNPGDLLSVQSDATFTYTITLPEPPEPVEPNGNESQAVVWTCSTSPCPWGPSSYGHALLWPQELQPLSARLGYTASGSVYLPAAVANGAIIWINSGSATLYAGQPDANSHAVLTTLTAGQFYEVGTLAAGDVLSVQSPSSFTYAVDLAQTPPPEPEPVPNQSALVTWNCTSSPCPWGATSSNPALVWPSELAPTDVRFGYTATAGVYLPAASANGMTVRITSGTATVYSGRPDANSHSALATLGAGQSYVVQGLQSEDVLSVQGDSTFTYALVTPDPNGPTDPSDPPLEGVIQSVAARWRCDLPGCSSADWIGEVINWPSWAAYSNNARSGEGSRTIYSDQGHVLHPYMGPWAHGCEVKAESGQVLIIEWQRGTDTWRETWLNPGETHVIDLQSPEDGALIETYDYGPRFSVSLNNCTPQPLP